MEVDMVGVLVADWEWAVVMEGVMAGVIEEVGGRGEVAMADKVTVVAASGAEVRVVVLREAAAQGAACEVAALTEGPVAVVATAAEARAAAMQAVESRVGVVVVGGAKAMVVVTMAGVGAALLGKVAGARDSKGVTRGVAMVEERVGVAEVA